MNYNYLLDSFFSSYWLCYGLLGLYIAVIVLLKTKLRPEQKKKLPNDFVSYYLIPTLWILIVTFLNPIVLGYGASRRISTLDARGGKLYVMDYLLTAGGKEMSGIQCYRMHIIDPQTGEKKLRFITKRPGYLLFANNDTLAFAHPDDITFYASATGRELAVWSAKTLPKFFPELASGIHNFDMYNPSKGLEVSSLDGNKWVLNIRNGSITRFDRHYQEKYEPTDSCYIENNAIRRDDQRFGTTMIALEDVVGTEHKRAICGPHDSIINPRLLFLYGKIIALSVKDSCFIIQDYETTNQDRVTFTCMSLDGKRRLWEVVQNRLRPGDSKTEPANAASCIDTQNDLFIASIKNEVMAFRMADGKMLWRQVP